MRAPHDQNDAVRIVPEPSPGLEARAAGLAGYLVGLHAGVERDLALAGLPRRLQAVRLLVLNEEEWRRHSRYPYGLTFYRQPKGGLGMVFAPGSYPERLLLVLARQVGAAAPGDPAEFLDLTLGHELGHGVAEQLGLRTRVRWLDEFLATYLFLAGLRASDAAKLRLALDWACVLSGGPRCALGDPSLMAAPARRDLGAFEYPLARLPLANQAWFQGRFTLQAAELLERRGLAFIVELVEGLPARRERGAVHRSVIRVEPSFRDWFRSFGDDAPLASPL